MNLSAQQIPGELGEHPSVVFYRIEGCSLCDSAFSAIQSVKNAPLPIVIVSINPDDVHDVSHLKKLAIKSLPALVVYNKGRPLSAVSGKIDTDIAENFLFTSAAEIFSDIKKYDARKAIASFFVFLIRSIRSLFLFKSPLVSDDLKNKRLRICGSCANRDGNRCGICTCPLSAKVLFKESSCDKKLW